jgi:hypothetical protein
MPSQFRIKLAIRLRVVESRLVGELVAGGFADALHKGRGYFAHLRKEKTS